MRSAILLLLAAAMNPVWGWDSTIVYTGSDLEGEMRLDADPRLFKNEPVRLQGIRFSLNSVYGPVVSNTGLPDFNATCSGVSYSALVVTHSQGASGFKAASDTDWNAAAAIPASLTPLDTLKDRYPEYTQRDIVIGTGWIHSKDVTQGCATIYQQSQPGYNRIFYYQSGRIHLKLQVESFQTSPAPCDTGIDPPCTKSGSVNLRYAISDSEDGSFPVHSSGVRVRSERPQRFRWTWTRPVWEYALGRKVANPAR